MTRITCVLGNLQLLGMPEGDTVEIKDAKGNATRWVFDVEQDAPGDITLRLVGFHQPRPLRSGTLLVPHIMAQNALAACSAIYCPETTAELLKICSERPAGDERGQVLRYRVTVDTFHSSNR